MNPRTTRAEIAVGRIAGKFGVTGELKCDPTEPGRMLFSPGEEFICRSGEDVRTLRIASVRPHKGRLLVRFDGIDTADAATPLAGTLLYADRERVELHEGEFFDEDLIGCAVVGERGYEYGTVERVEHYPASDMLVVCGHLVPMVAAIVRNVDLSSRQITIDPPDGLFE